MRLLSRVLFILVVCLIALALPAVPVRAECVPYDIELSPESGPPGTEVEVYGHDFEANEFVDIRYDGVLVSEGTETGPSGDFRIIIRIPEGCSGHYQVHADVGHAEADAYFAVKPGLTVSPETGPLGTNVTVKGGGFAENEEGIEVMYYLNGSYDTIERNVVANAQGSWETNFQVPPSGRGEHKVDAQGPESKYYEVQDASFRVTADVGIDKSSGIVGDTITMTGSRFAVNEKGITILFDGEPMVTGITASPEGEWQASFEVTEMPTGSYSMTVEGEQTKKEDLRELAFKIEPDIVLSHTEGHVGTNLTIAGHGFAASEDVNITYDTGQMAITETNDRGSFDVSFLVPESKYGEHTVAAGYGTGNAANAIFTMESDSPPRPTLISPANRSRLGLMGNVTPTLQWSGVSDDSGVRYSLQIATSDTVTGTGELPDPIFSATGLVGTNCTLEETEALSQGTYYWIVQAVDRAENEGDWTTAYSFRVGLLPRWAFIAIIVAIVLMIAALIRALVRRRTIYYDRW